VLDASVATARVRGSLVATPPRRRLELTARLKSVDDLDLLLSVLESNRAFFVKNDRLAAEVLTLT
jgi:hypothetical protein